MLTLFKGNNHNNNKKNKVANTGTEFSLFLTNA